MIRRLRPDPHIGPAKVQDDRFRLADTFGQRPIARRLAGLLLQPGKLGFHGPDDVIEPEEVVLRRAQPQLGFVTAAVETDDAGRFLQQHAPFAGLGGDQGADAPLAHQSRRPRPAGVVLEQKLHVTGPNRTAVDPIVGPGAPLDAAHHIQPLGTVERSGGGAGAVVEGQRHLGDVARRAIMGAAEDDVVHPGAAHALGRRFAHDPAQRLDKVGLAATVRPDNTGNARLNGQLRRLDEGLEPGETKRDELHLRQTPCGQPPIIPSMISAKASKERAPETDSPLMMKVGVALTS